MCAARYAQHFLINRHAVERIVELANLKADDVVLEIGPGKGAVTELLAQKGSRIIAVEIDPRLATYLHTKLHARVNVEIVQSDILRFDFESLKNHSAGRPIKVVGNLPYNLTSPILRRLSDWPGWNEAILMVQKEVGDRICASANTATYGALTVGVSLTSIAEHVFDLSESSFSPPPRVKSSVIKLTRRLKPLASDSVAVQRVVQAAFQQRRKTILNSMSHGLALSKERVQELLTQVGLTPELRAEQISVEQYVSLAETLEGKHRH